MKSFLLNRAFVRELAERYHADKMLWFGVFSDERKRHASDESQEPMPFSKTRIENHITQMIKVVFWASLEMEERRYHDFTLTYSGLDEPGLADRSFLFSEAIHPDQIECVDEESLELLDSLFGWPKRTDIVNEELIIQTLRRSDPKTIALALRAHAHGGALLIVPNGHEGWMNSIQMERLRFRGSPYEGIKRDLEERDRAWGKSNIEVAFERAQRSLRSLAQLTAVDGAAVVSHDLTILAFGAEIRPVAHTAGSGDRGNQLDCVLVSLPFEKSRQRKVPLADLGGTRHKSAAQFVFDQKDVDPRAIVVSSDGGISLYCWDQNNARVSVTRGAEFLLL